MNQAGFTTLLYLDDRIIIEKLLRKLDPEETGIGVYCLLCLLVAFGGFVSPKKCDFIPKQQGRFLGFDFDSVAQTVTVPAEKHAKVVAQIQEFLEGEIIECKRYCDMQLLEQIRGRIISWCLVVMNFGFYTREMNAAIAAHYARFPGPRALDRYMLLSEIDGYEYLVDELLVWRDLEFVKLTRKWIPEDHVYLGETLELYTDASGGGLGSARVVNGKKLDRKYPLPAWLAPLPIHCKEAYVIIVAIESHGTYYHNRRLLVWCDNRSVVDAWNGRGSRDRDLARILRQLCDLCHRCGIILNIKWVDTENQLADEPSRQMTPIFSRLKEKISRRLTHYLHVNLDLFASPADTICERFYSEYPYPQAHGVDGLTYSQFNKADDIVYAYPPRVLQLPFLKVIFESWLFNSFGFYFIQLGAEKGVIFVLYTAMQEIYSILSWAFFETSTT